MTKETTTTKDSNTLLDRVWQGAAAFALVAGLYAEVYRHIKATGYTRHGLAAFAVGFVLYMLVVPQFRK